MVVKWKYFRHLLGFYEKGAERRYIWHINERIGPRMRAGLPTDQWKRCIEDYQKASEQLLVSMRRDGFLPTEPIPIDVEGELFGGAHRLACAMALNIKLVTVNQIDNKVWASPWNMAWFVEHGMEPSDLRQIENDWELLQWVS